MEKINFFASLKLLKKGVGSASISQRYGSPDPDPHQNVTDPQHWLYMYLVGTLLQLWIDNSFFLFRDEEDLFEDMEMTEALVKDEEDLIAQVLKVKKECWINVAPCQPQTTFGRRAAKLSRASPSLKFPLS